MKHHILVAEDNGTHRAMTHDILLEMGFDVTSVDNGYTAISKIAANPHEFALVIMDWEMPQMNGLDAVRAMRVHQEKDGWPHIPVIAFTGNKRPGDQEKCIAAGMDDYVPKEIFMPKWRTVLNDKLKQWLKEDDSQDLGVPDTPPLSSNSTTPEGD